MRALLDGKRVTLDTANTLGSGGEATVFALTRGNERLAAKVYHQPSEARARKLEALLARSQEFSASVIAPKELLLDAIGQRVIGFAMSALPLGCEPISQLSRKSFRDARSIGRREASLILSRLGHELASLHGVGIVVGDLNDQNELFTPDLEVRFIDVDSFQTPGFDCEVATETFLDPLLYGPDPAAPCLTNGRTRRFGTDNDWYSFAVIAFRTLTGVHPYGGVSRDLPTLSARARARHSVLSEDICLPPLVRESVNLLTRDLRSSFESVFDGGAREVFAISALETYAQEIVRCSCGLDLPATRLPCPRCRPLTRPLIPRFGKAGLETRTLCEARGPIIALFARGETTLAVALEDGVPVLYEIGVTTRRDPLTTSRSRSGWVVSLSSDRVAFAPQGSPEGTWVALDSRVATPFVTEVAMGRACFATALETVYRVARGTLLSIRSDSGAISEAPVTTVMTEQTRLVASSGAVLASERMLRQRHVIAFDRGRRVDLDLEPLESSESLLEEVLLACQTTFAVLRLTSVGGQSFVRAASFDRNGKPRARSMQAVSSRLAEDALSGGVLSGDVHVVATDRGLVREDLSGGSAPTLFSETAAFVGRDALLASAPGCLVVAHDRVIRALKLSSSTS